MFSKALFKQSCKANGMMWAIIAFAVCFMLACVMLISGNGFTIWTAVAIIALAALLYLLVRKNKYDENTLRVHEVAAAK